METLPVKVRGEETSSVETFVGLSLTLKNRKAPKSITEGHTSNKKRGKGNTHSKQSVRNW